MRIPLLLVALSAAAASQAGSILGIDDARIYKIDVATGLATSVGSLAGTGSAQANALAYSAANDTAYFQRGGKLWGMNVATGAITDQRVAVGATAAATFYGGAYYFMGQGDGKLSKVDLAAGTSTLVKDFTNDWSFGDVATDAAGKLYGSSGGSVFSIDLAAPTLSVLSESTRGVQTQLGFVGATLYGIATGNAAGGAKGQIFTFNGSVGMVATGTTARFNGGALGINDAATYNPVPEPASMAALALGALGILRRRKRA